MPKPKKPDAPMMLASVEQAVRTLREWGWEVTPVMGHRNRYRAQKPRGNMRSDRGGKPYQDMVSFEIRAGKSSRVEEQSTLAGEVLRDALSEDIRRRCGWQGVEELHRQVSLTHASFRNRTFPAQELALYLSRILRDAFPDVADLLDVHAHGGSL